MISWVDRCPDEWAEGFCALESAFLTLAPIGDLDVEPETWTVERLRDAEARRKQSGRTTYATAVVAPDGSLAGNTGCRRRSRWCAAAPRRAAPSCCRTTVGTGSGWR